MTMAIIPVGHARRYPPRVTAFTEPFWAGLLNGEFRVTRCATCSKASFPPKPICPHCWADEVRWEVIDTKGTLYSWTRVHAGPAIFESDLPFPVGIVDLDIGIRLACPLHGEAVDWGCGLRTDLVTLAYADGPLFAATPANDFTVS
jgi:uncharacterized OB-fold protein